jgi:hypothetical protein
MKKPVAITHRHETWTHDKKSFPLVDVGERIFRLLDHFAGGVAYVESEEGVPLLINVRTQGFRVLEEVTESDPWTLIEGRLILKGYLSGSASELQAFRDVRVRPLAQRLAQLVSSVSYTQSVQLVLAQLSALSTGAADVEQTSLTTD